jgi:hypothetical protein
VFCGVFFIDRVRFGSACLACRASPCPAGIRRRNDEWRRIRRNGQDKPFRIQESLHISRNPTETKVIFSFLKSCSIPVPFSGGAFPLFPQGGARFSPFETEFMGKEDGYGGERFINNPSGQRPGTFPVFYANSAPDQGCATPVAVLFERGGGCKRENCLILKSFFRLHRLWGRPFFVSIARNKKPLDKRAA